MIYVFYLPSEKEKKETLSRLPEKTTKQGGKKNPGQETGKRPLEADGLNMLPKRYRLKKSADIQRVLREERSARFGDLIVKKNTNDLGHSRFSVSFSLKVSKKASRRNKIRRIITETIRRNLPKTEKESFDKVFLTLPGIENKNFKEIEGNVEKFFS